MLRNNALIYFEVVCKMLAHFTFVDVKNIMTKQGYFRHVTMLPARIEISLG